MKDKAGQGWIYPRVVAKLDVRGSPLNIVLADGGRIVLGDVELGVVEDNRLLVIMSALFNTMLENNLPRLRCSCDRQQQPQQPTSAA
jgi:hypothetical protein